MATKTIKLIKPYSLHSKGAVLSIDEGLAHALISSGRAEALEQEAPKDKEPLKKMNKRRNARNR